MIYLACNKSSINDERYFFAITLGETVKVRINFLPKPSVMASDPQMRGGAR